MKKLVAGSLAFVFALVLSTSAFARTLEITEYCGENGLINRGNDPVRTGDVLNVKNDITQEADETGYIEPNLILSYGITINGNGHTFDGNGYDGFHMSDYNSGEFQSSTINNATLTNYSGNYLVGVSASDWPGVELTLKDVNIIDNDASINVGWASTLNIVSNGTVNISSNTGGIVNEEGGTINFKGNDVYIANTSVENNSEMYNDSNLTIDSDLTIGEMGSFENRKTANLNGAVGGYGYVRNFGTMNIGGDASGFTGDIYVDNGTINLLKGGTYFNGAYWHTYAGNTTLNLINETIDNVVMQNLELSRTTMKVNIDVDLSAGQKSAGDYLDIGYVYNNDYPRIEISRAKAVQLPNDDFTPISKILIDKINVLADSPDEEEVSVEIANSDYQEYIHLARNRAYSTYYGYNVKISSSGSTPGEINIVKASDNSDSSNVDYGNKLIFSRIDDKARNPKLLQSKVAIAGSNISQDEIFTTVFNNAGNYTFFQKQGSNAGDVEDRDAPTLWVKAFGSKEDVDLEEYTKVETTYYGAVVGLDWDRQYTDNFDATYGIFASYVGGELKDDDWDNKVKQNGGYVGVRGNWYFGKLFVNGIIDYALIQNSADTTEDSNDFNSQVAGLAARLGYNFEVARRSFTIQPNLGVTGKYIITDDYDTTIDGDKRKLSIDDITNITIEPGLKLVKNLGKCWILTGEGKYVIENVSGDVTADDIVLPDTSYDNFANVGLGIEKIWGYTVLQLKANKTFGGRDGFIINAGIEFKF